MGNESSSNSNMDLSSEILEENQHWLRRTGFTPQSIKLTIFEENTNVSKFPTALRKLSKNLMLHRHPYILKYVSTWNNRKGGKVYVATEYALPLEQVIRDQTPMQLCLGLFNIFKALCFLHEKSFSSHNNLSKSSIYVTVDGIWKLAGLEVMCKFCDLNEKYMKEIEGMRSKPFPKGRNPDESIDQYDFALFSLDILRDIGNDQLPYVEEFKELCDRYVKDAIFAKEELESFVQLACHPFFTHKFVQIYTFLMEIPVKSETEKNIFFRTLADKLADYPEKLVAQLLISPLLSRVVLLNETAQMDVLTRILAPKSHNDASLFSDDIFKTHVIPRLSVMFHVRDSQIRLVLLRFFHSFLQLFDQDELQDVILPELLVGIKDANDTLVAETLHALADLVPILGSSVVIGKSRAKLFADGFPAAATGKKCAVVEFQVERERRPACLTERPSPDGGEAEGDVVAVKDEKEEPQPLVASSVIAVPALCRPALKVNSAIMKLPGVKSKQQDLSRLDVKYCNTSVKSEKAFDDIDLMFKDMEPVICKTATVAMEVPQISKYRFDAAAKETDFSGDGWDEILQENLSDA